jgi:hypothetical protein
MERDGSHGEQEPEGSVEGFALNEKNSTILKLVRIGDRCRRPCLMSASRHGDGECFLSRDQGFAGSRLSGRVFPAAAVLHPALA